jgi:competence protein ComEC
LTKFRELLIRERERLPLFCPVIFGFGIIFGVFNPFFAFNTLLCFLGISIVFALICFKNPILSFAIILFSIGVYVAQTGGLLETSLLSQKRFLTEEHDRITFLADVGFIEISHPTMKNMQRIIFKNIEFQERDKLSFIKTAKMTVASSVISNASTNDRMRIVGRLIPYKTASIPMSFDQAQYNALIKMDAAGVVFKAEKIGQGSRYIDIFSSIRMTLTNLIIEKMGRTAGGIGSALVTGDKSTISPEIRDKFINSGTAHILAISGLHMSLIASILFFIFFKLSLYIGLIFVKFNARKCAALLTIATTYLYLALSGFSPSANRAFIMTTIGLLGIIFGRGAVSLRNISFAALVILLFDPASLFLVSFQLSFCAVTALISFYEQYKHVFANLSYKSKSIIQKFFMYIIASSVTTTIASLATFPISVATFNRYSLSGILGNLVAIPLTSTVIMPLGVVSIVLCQLTDIPIKVLEIAIYFLIDCVGWAATIKGSNLTIKSPQILTLYMLTFGGILLCLLKTKLRHVGSILIAIFPFVWIFEKGPNLIIPPNARSACTVEDGVVRVTSLRKGRNQFLSIQRNLGLSGRLEKIDEDCLPIDCRLHKQGLFLWIDDGKIVRASMIAKKSHPYCPATFQDIDANFLKK